jgi:hypothetical protein
MKEDLLVDNSLMFLPHCLSEILVHQTTRVPT